MTKIPLRVPSEKIIKATVRQLVFGRRPRCPRCSRSRTVHQSERRYRCAKCRRPFSLTSGSWLKSSKLSWSQLWLLLYCFGHKYQPRQAVEVSGVSLVTVRRYYHLFRVNLPLRERKLDALVCCDEGYFGKRKTGNQRIVAGVIEPMTKEVRLKIIPDVAQDSLEQFLVDHVERDSLVYTDQLKSYQAIEWLGYGHETENHSRNQLKHTVPIERIWSHAKWQMRRMYHHLWAKTLPEFLREMEWRYPHPEIFENPLSLLEILLTPVPNG